jgi:hypothetical protein
MTVEQQDLLTQSLKLKHTPSVPQDTRYNHNYRNTTKRLTQQTDVHEREIVKTIYKHKFRNLDITFASASARCGRW